MPARPSATVARASDHDASTSSSPLRTSGAVSRSSLLTASKSNRPLSHIQLWLTGSLSMPRYRVIRSPLDCTATRHPTAQEVHVLSTCSRSHGRARKR